MRWSVCFDEKKQENPHGKNRCKKVDRVIKKYAFNTVLVFISLVIAVLALEGMLRWTGYKTPNCFLPYRHYYCVADDGEAGYDILKNFPITEAHIEGDYYYEFWSNELCCYDVPYNGEKKYVLLVGDSFTHMYAPFKDKWGTVLEKALGYRVLKCGVTGYGTRQELKKAEKIISQLQVPPQLIVVGYFMNDMVDDYRCRKYATVNGFLVNTEEVIDFKKLTLRERDRQELDRGVEEFFTLDSARDPFVKRTDRWLQRNSALYKKIKIPLINALSTPENPARFLKNTRIDVSTPVPLPPPYPFLEVFWPEREYPWLKKAWGRNFENLRAFKKLAEKHRAKLLVVIIPAKEQVYPFLIANRYKWVDLKKPNRILKNFFQKEQISYIDLLPLLKKYARREPKKLLDPESDLYWRLDAHWNKKGNHLAGLMVARNILAKNFLDVHDSDKRLSTVEKQLDNFK